MTERKSLNVEVPWPDQALDINRLRKALQAIAWAADAGRQFNLEQPEEMQKLFVLIRETAREAYLGVPFAEGVLSEKSHD